MQTGCNASLLHLPTSFAVRCRRTCYKDSHMHGTIAAAGGLENWHTCLLPTLVQHNTPSTCGLSMAGSVDQLHIRSRHAAAACPDRTRGGQGFERAARTAGCACHSRSSRGRGRRCPTARRWSRTAPRRRWTRRTAAPWWPAPSDPAPGEGAARTSAASLCHVFLLGKCRLSTSCSWTLRDSWVWRLDPYDMRRLEAPALVNRYW